MEEITDTLDSDIISNLPRNITDTILTCLPLREAVRSSILSKRWRYWWINLPNLVIDEPMFKFSNLTKNRIKYKIVSIIYRILFAHQGPLLKFSLSHSYLERPDFDNIIIFLSKNRVEDFTLYGLMKEIQEKYKLPSSFFSCRELKHMNISSCVFTPPHAFEGFRMLISLKFVEVDIAIDLFESFVSSCPQLERLTLVNPTRFPSLSIRALNLKYLHLEGSREQIVIDESEKNVHLKDGEECRLVKFFQCLPALNTLITPSVLLKQLAAGGVPEKLPTSINLKFLKLSEILFGSLTEVSILYSLISSSSMKRIEVEAYMPQLKIDESPVLNFLKAVDFNAHMFDKLQEVKLSIISGTEAELNFIKLLLAKSHVLEKIFIKHRLVQFSSRLELLKILTRFKRSSPMAEIIFE